MSDLIRQFVVFASQQRRLGRIMLDVKVIHHRDVIWGGFPFSKQKHHSRGLWMLRFFSESDDWQQLAVLRLPLALSFSSIFSGLIYKGMDAKLDLWLNRMHEKNMRKCQFPNRIPWPVAILRCSKRVINEPLFSRQMLLLPLAKKKKWPRTPRM